MTVIIIWDYNMVTNRVQITSRGIAQQSGLEVFVSSITYGGEFLSLGQPLVISNINAADDHATTATDPQLDAIESLPPETANIWYKYHTSGLPYIVVAAPLIVGSYAEFYGQEVDTLPSYGGIYQKLSGLTIGKEYYVTVVIPSSTIQGTFTIKTYQDTGASVRETSSTSFSMPYASGNMTTTFTAISENDIILFDFTTESTSAVIQKIYSISIEEKQEFLVPLYAEDMWGNNHQVLRRNLGNTLSDS